jgi:hypothetical protein
MRWCVRLGTKVHFVREKWQNNAPNEKFGAFNAMREKPKPVQFTGVRFGAPFCA